MLHNHKRWGVVPGLLVVVFLAACNQERLGLDRSKLGTPSKKVVGSGCIPGKMTGGGRIDAPPGGPDKNPPASHQFQTFGAHVISEGLAADGQTCVVKGSLEWVDHSLRVGGRPLNLHSEAITFVNELPEGDCKDGSLTWGGRLVEKNTGEEYDFQVFDCDNGEPGAKHDGFNILLSGPGKSQDGYTLFCPGSIHLDRTLCTLTGGNRQFHPTH